MACTIDFRCLDEGLGGKTYKRKRSQQAEEINRLIRPQEDNGAVSMDVDSMRPPPSKGPAMGSSNNPDKPVFGKPTYDGVMAGKVSGRKWKGPRMQGSSAMNVSPKSPALEQQMKEKEIKRAYNERMRELKAIRQNKVEKRKKREEREKRKQENILRSGTKQQKITNPKTLKKIAKSKKRKLLKVAPDALLNNKPK